MQIPTIATLSLLTFGRYAEFSFQDIANLAQQAYGLPSWFEIRISSWDALLQCSLCGKPRTCRWDASSQPLLQRAICCPLWTLSANIPLTASVSGVSTSHAWVTHHCSCPTSFNISLKSSFWESSEFIHLGLA